MFYRDREELIDIVKAIGKDIINNAESIVGDNADHLSCFNIWIRLDPDSVPSYEVEKEYTVPLTLDEDGEYQ